MLNCVHYKFTLTNYMIFLFASIVLYAINNVLWARYAPSQNTISLINRRSLFTSTLMFLLMFFFIDGNNLNLTMDHILNLVLCSIVGFLGLHLLAQGFKRDNVLQYSLYNLLFVITLAFTSEELKWSFPIFGGIVGVCIGFILMTLSGKKDERTPITKPFHLYFVLAHCCFGILLFLQQELLLSIDSTIIAWFNEIIILLITGMILGTRYFIKKAPLKERPLNWWRYLIFAIPITLAVWFGLKGLKLTDPFQLALVGLFVPFCTLCIDSFLNNKKIQSLTWLGFFVMVMGLYFIYL